MGRPSKEPPSPSSLVPAIVRYARARGFGAEALEWRFGLAGITEGQDLPVAPDTPNDLLEAIAATEPDAALHLAADLPSRHHALVALSARSSATVGAALSLLARWTRLLHEGFEATVDDAPSGVEGATAEAETRWVLRTPHRPRGLGRHLHELALAYALARLREGAGDDLAPTRIWFAHARPPEIRSLLRFFSAADFEFGRETTGMAFSPTAIERPMRLADPRTVGAVVPLVDAALPAAGRRSFAERVAGYIASSLPAGADASETARALHMSPRTLHRRLEQEGARFGELLDEVRLDLARKLLADPALTLGEIAMRLGFADLATFSRAFKRWTGQPPGQWRRS
jgi:AraC-like DNA-binding protein